MFLHDMNFQSLLPVSFWNRLRAHKVLREKMMKQRNCAFGDGAFTAHLQAESSVLSSA